MTCTRYVAFRMYDTKTQQRYLDYNKTEPTALIFMASSETRVSRDLYRVEDKSLSSADIELHLGYIGRTSHNSVATLTDNNTGMVLVRNVNQVVNVDRTTHKPIPISDWWRVIYGSYAVEKKSLEVAEEIVPNEKIYWYELKVAWSEIDFYQHTNYLSYVKFCFDAAMDAVSNQFYTMFHKDILNYHVKSVRSFYKGESVAGDILNIASWEDNSNPFLLHFSIQKGSNILFQSHVEFYCD